MPEEKYSRKLKIAQREFIRHALAYNFPLSLIYNMEVKRLT